MELWRVEHFYNIFVSTFGRDYYFIQQSHPKVKTNIYVVKVFNPSEFHFSEVTFFQNWYFRIRMEFFKTLICATK